MPGVHIHADIHLGVPALPVPVPVLELPVSRESNSLKSSHLMR
jgi:hypothetical protein